jgi:diguanylate cyclase (GGDEF)-like protein/PAS domain S-box-containing protein
MKVRTMRRAGAAGANTSGAAGQAGESAVPSAKSRVITRLAPLGVAVILLSLAVFAGWAVLTSRTAAAHVAVTSTENNLFETAHYAVGQEDSLDHQYLVEPGPEVLASHHAAGVTLAEALGRLRDVGDREDRDLAASLLADHARYLDATGRMFAAVDAGDTPRVNQIHTGEVDPAFGAIQRSIETQSAAHRVEEIGAVNDLSAINRIIFWSALILTGLGLALITVLWIMLRTYQRRRAQFAQFERNVLRRNEARFRALVQNSSDMITVIAADTTVLYQSPASARVLGYEAAELEGTRASGFLHPDDFERIGIFFAKAVKHDASPMTVEARLRHGDGSWRQAEILVSNRLADEQVGGFVLNIRDVTERKQAEDALRDRQQQLYMIFETSPDLIAIHEVDGRYRVANSATTATLGYTQAELLRDGIAERIHPDDVAKVNASWRELVRGSGHAITSMRVRHADGRWIVLESHASALRDQSGQIVGVVAVSRDITEREQAQQTLRRTLADLAISKAQLEEKSAMLESTLVAEREQARRDPLTNALNHGAISDALRDLVSGVHTDTPMCAVAMVDIDGMKAVNDTYGHQAGDMVLITVANVLGHRGALVGRYGGDEFVVILQGAGRDDAERYRDDVLDNLRRAKLIDPETQANIPVRVSVGLAIYPEEAKTVAELVGLSDNAMYAAKRQRSASGDDLAGLRPMGDERAAKMVGELAPLLTSEGDVSSKLRLVAHRLSVGVGYDAVDFTLFAPTPGAPLAASTFARIPADVLEAWNRRPSRDTAEPHPLRAYFARSPRPVVIEDLPSSDLVTPDQRLILAAAGLRSGLVAPLIWRDEVVGMLAVGSRQHGAFTAQDAQFVGSVATQVTAIVRMAQLVDELQGATARLSAAQAETVMMLAAAAEAHDRETGLHLLSIRTLAEALARELGYADGAVRDLGLAAVLHDIGKISVPDAVLSSSGSLQDDEWEVMKRHTLWGAEFLSGKPGFELAATVARSHHERWDGGGYPDGLAGEDIPEAATIVTVADSFDAMTHDRPYKLSRPVEDAIQEIVACSGEQFSPRIVEALVRLHQRGEVSHTPHVAESDRLAA